MTLSCAIDEIARLVPKTGSLPLAILRVATLLLVKDNRHLVFYFFTALKGPKPSSLLAHIINIVQDAISACPCQGFPLN